jgi:hypothetical protein
MDGLLNQSLLNIFGKGIPMKFRIAVRVINATIVILIYNKLGIDAVIVYTAIVLMTDLDSIAEQLEKKFQKDKE